MVEISGNIDNLQSSVDFYLSVTSKEEILDSRFMRDKFFELFKNEESLRGESFLNYPDLVTDDYEIDTSVEPVLVGGEELFDGNVCYFQTEVNSLNNVESDFEYPEDDEVYSENNVLDIKKIALEKEKLPSISEESILEDEKEELEDEFVSPEYEEVEDGEDSFNNWGIYDFDENGEDSSEESIFDSWGDNVEDDTEYDEDGGEESIFDSWGNNVEDDSEDDEDSSEESIFGSWGNNEEVDVGDDEKQVFEEWSFEDEKVNSLESSSSGSKLDGSDVDKEKDTFTQKNIVVSVPKNKSSVPEGSAVVPNDLREFIKMYPNCELSVVYKYFSKKEVEKQLKLGRVFKRKNKLLI